MDRSLAQFEFASLACRSAWELDADRRSNPLTLSGVKVRRRTTREFGGRRQPGDSPTGNRAHRPGGGPGVGMCLGIRAAGISGRPSGISGRPYRGNRS